MGVFFLPASGGRGGLEPPRAPLLRSLVLELAAQRKALAFEAHQSEFDTRLGEHQPSRQSPKVDGTDELEVPANGLRRDLVRPRRQRLRRRLRRRCPPQKVVIW